MVIKNCTTNVSFGPRYWNPKGSNGETYTVTHFHDETWTCTCANFEYVIKHAVLVTGGCKHIQSAAAGEYGKPHCRARHRPMTREHCDLCDQGRCDENWHPYCIGDERCSQRPPARRARISDEGREIAAMLDV